MATGLQQGSGISIRARMAFYQSDILSLNERKRFGMQIILIHRQLVEDVVAGF
jgi:hypothetical protein